jgi:gamma-carbonic anhydrase
VFPGARLGPGAEVRINGVVHVNTVLPADSVVPIGWVAAGDPAQILSPDRHDEIWAIQRPLDFSQTVYGVSRETPAADRMALQTAWFAAHRHDTPAAD